MNYHNTTWVPKHIGNTYLAKQQSPTTYIFTSLTSGLEISVSSAWVAENAKHFTIKPTGVIYKNKGRRRELS